MLNESSSRHVSPWVDTMAPPRNPSAMLGPGGDVIVIGGGIVGMTTALLLQRAGRQVTVVDAKGLAHSVTTHSTVKVTVGHGALYSQIEDKRGFDAAKTYADANAAGFDLIVELIGTLGIDCMLEQGLPHVVYAETDDDREKVEREAEIVSRVGLRATLRQDAPLPFGVAAALHFENQAQFHPGRYLVGLADAFTAGGGTLVEGVRAVDVDEDSDICHVETTGGAVSAPHVVVATQVPFLNRGGHFAWLEPTRSYGIAGVLADDVEAGMTINVGSPTHSTRTATLDGIRHLIVVGEGHQVGHVTDTAERWTRLRQWASDQFGVTDFRYHWSAEETNSFDKVPFAGLISPVSKRIFTAAGFDGWGMTNGTASALMIRDLIVGNDNPWIETFDARRAEKSLPRGEFIKHNVEVGKMWLKDRLSSGKGDLEDLQPGDAGILNINGEKMAAYRDDTGRVHALSPVCTHMGCDVEWNNGEKSWDCPCHGSRFSFDGDVLHGPATSPLERRDL